MLKYVTTQGCRLKNGSLLAKMSKKPTTFCIGCIFYSPNFNFIGLFGLTNLTAERWSEKSNVSGICCTCNPGGPVAPLKPRGPSSPLGPYIPCCPRGPGSPSRPWKRHQHWTVNTYRIPTSITLTLGHAHHTHTYSWSWLSRRSLAPRRPWGTLWDKMQRYGDTYL